MKDLIKVRIDKCSTSMFWWYHQIGSQINVEEHPIDKSSFKLVGLPQTIKKSDCTALSDTGEKDEPKGYCIKRTPENAEVLNKWMNSIDWKLRYDRDYGYVISETSDIWGMVYDEIPEGFTELFTVEDFFEKVGYNPVSEYEKQLEEKFIPEPKNYHSSRTDKLYLHFLEKHDFMFTTDDLNDIIDIAIKSDKVEVVEEPKGIKLPHKENPAWGEPEKPIDKVTIEVLDSVLRMCNIQLHATLIDKIIDCVELIEDKKGSVNIGDVIKMKQEWEVKRPIK